MGHAITYEVVNNKKDVLPVAEDFAFYNVDRQENPSGSYHGSMTIHEDRIFDSYEEAEDAIKFLDNGWYDDHAVMFKDTRDLTNSKIKMLESRIEQQRKDRAMYIEKNSVKHRKSELIGCPNCNSKLSRVYLRNESCPLCNTDLRSQTIKNRIEKYKNDIKQLEKQIKAEQKKLINKAKVKWLVKVEVHC